MHITANPAGASPNEVSTPWMNLYEVAAYARMTPAAIRQAEKRKQIKAYRTTTGRVRFLKSDVENFLTGGAA